VTVITISRQFGSGGREIAAQVCALLGYRYLDKLLITQVAAEVGLSGKELAEFSEEQPQVKSFLERLLLPGPHDVIRVAVRSRDVGGEQTLTVKHLDEARCASLVRSAIHTAYQQGDVVVVGRGGQATLQEMAGTLHVRIEAPMGTRILRIQKREAVDAEAARRLAIQRDQATAQYLKRLFGIQWDDPTLYHILINTGKCELEAAAQLILSAVRQLPAKTAG
jgi:cytidylate kinase